MAAHEEFAVGHILKKFVAVAAMFICEFEATAANRICGIDLCAGAAARRGVCSHGPGGSNRCNRQVDNNIFEPVRESLDLTLITLDREFRSGNCAIVLESIGNIPAHLRRQRTHLSATAARRCIGTRAARAKMHLGLSCARGTARAAALETTKAAGTASTAFERPGKSFWGTRIRT